MGPLSTSSPRLLLSVLALKTTCLASVRAPRLRVSHYMGIQLFPTIGDPRETASKHPECGGHGSAVTGQGQVNSRLRRCGLGEGYGKCCQGIDIQSKSKGDGEESALAHLWDKPWSGVPKIARKQGRGESSCDDRGLYVPALLRVVDGRTLGESLTEASQAGVLPVKSTTKLGLSTK